MIMQCRLGPPGHRPLSNKKKIIKIGPYAEELYGDKQKNKKIQTDRIYNLLLFEVG